MKSLLLRTPLLCMGLLALTACGKKQEQQQPPPPEVGVVSIHPQSTALIQNLVGRLGAYRSADVRARVSGVVLKRVYTEGTDVKQGQLMFELDPKPYKATLDADLASLAQAKASYANYHVIAERYRQLSPQGYVSKQDLDTAEANERSGAAAVQQAAATAETARVNLDYTRVVAPISGRSGQQQVTEGALVGDSVADGGASSTLLTSISQIDPLYVNFTVPVNELDDLRQAQKTGAATLNAQGQSEVQLTLSDGSPVTQKGVLDFSSVVTDATTGAVTLRAVLPNPDYALLPGQYVKLNLAMGEMHNVFLIPQQALQRDSIGPYVFVVGQDGTVIRKNVQSETLRSNAWIVTDGLSSGDQVIVTGVQGVSEGVKANAKPWSADNASSKPAASSSSSAQK